MGFFDKSPCLPFCLRVLRTFRKMRERRAICRFRSAGVLVFDSWRKSKAVLDEGNKEQDCPDAEEDFSRKVKDFHLFDGLQSLHS